MWRELLEWLRVPRTHKLTIPREVVEAATNPLTRMAARLEALSGLEVLKRFEETHALPSTFFDELALAMVDYDRFIAIIVEGAHLAVQCQKGCTACCHDAPTGVSAPELLLIYQSYRGFPDATALHDQACTLSDLLFGEVQLTKGQTWTKTDSPAFRRAQLAYRKRREPCLFLDGESGTCRIYKARPISCRMHLSVTDPAWCWADSPEARRALSPNIAPPPVIRKRLDELGHRLGLDGQSPVLFRGVAELGGRVFRDRPLVVTGGSRAPHPKRGRTGKSGRNGKARRVA